MVLYLKQYVPFTQWCFVPSFVEIGPVVLKKNFIYLVIVFPLFLINSPWKRMGTFVCTNLNPLHPRMFCTKFGWNWPLGFGKKEYSISSMYFHYSVNVSPWKRVGPFIWRNLISLNLKMLCIKFGWNWLSGSREVEKVYEDNRLQLMWAKNLMLQSIFKPKYELPSQTFFNKVFFIQIKWSYTLSEQALGAWDIWKVTGFYHNITIPRDKRGKYGISVDLTVFQNLLILVCCHYLYDWNNADMA